MREGTEAAAVALSSRSPLTRKLAGMNVGAPSQPPGLLYDERVPVSTLLEARMWCVTPKLKFVMIEGISTISS